MSFIDDMLTGKNIGKEANLIPQGENREDHFERKVEASNWIADTLALDADKVDSEFLAAQAAEAKLLGKTAAYEQGETVKETIEKDFKRDVSILSDYVLAELIAEAKAHKDNITQEKYGEYKEDAKKQVASSREKAEKALLELTADHTVLDWRKSFERFEKESKIEQPSEKDLYKPEVPEKAYDMDSPAENKFKMPTKEEMVPEGNGREADKCKEVTKEASQKVAEKVKDNPADDKGNLAMPEGKKSAGDKPVESVEESTLLPSPKEIGDKDDQAMEGNSPEKGDKAKDIESVNKEAHCGSCPGDPGVKTAEVCDLCKGQAQKEDWVYCPKCKPMPEQKTADGPSASDNCPVCGSEGQDLMNGQADSIACQACGITYAPSEIKACASKAETIKKIAEVESPWKVIKDEKGNEVIARVGIADKNIKESEEIIGKGSIKSADHIHAPAPKDEKLPVEKEIEDEEKPEAKPEEKPEAKPEAKPAAAAPAPAVAPVAPVTPAVAVPAAPSASASTGGDTTSPTRTNTETGGSSPGGASTGGVGSGIGGAGTGGAATGGASTGGAGTVTVNVSGGSGTNEDGGKSAPVTINISNVGGNTDAGNVASGDGPGAAGAGGKGDGSGGGGGGAAPDEPRNFSTSSKDEKKDESDPSMFSKDISEAGDSEPAAKPEEKPEEKESTLDPINSGSDWIRDLLK
jgi:hypothetical protein